MIISPRPPSLFSQPPKESLKKSFIFVFCFAVLIYKAYLKALLEPDLLMAGLNIKFKKILLWFGINVVSNF